MSHVPDGHFPEGHFPEGHFPEAATAAAPIDVRQRFKATFPFYAVDAASFHTFSPAVKDPAEQLKVELDLFAWCANFWQPNEIVVADEHVHPRRATGLIYRGTAGRTGPREPVWPQAVGAQVTSGSVTFTAVADGPEALNAMVDPSAASDPNGLTVTDVAVSEYTKLLATYVGGTVGQDFDAIFSFTLNGSPRVARQRVLVRKR